MAVLSTPVEAQAVVLVLSNPKDANNRPFLDKVHDKLEDDRGAAPAQLYTTQSGQMYHSGKIAIVLVGLPARGKTHTAVAIARYLRWQGVNAHTFHLGDYRRQHLPAGAPLPRDYFFVNGASASSVLLRQQIVKSCKDDIYDFFDNHRGQVAIYDAVNPSAAGRDALAKEFAKNGIETIFIENTCTKREIVEENIRAVKISSPDYAGWNADDAVNDYLARIDLKIPHYEPTETQKHLRVIQVIDAGQRIQARNCKVGYLPNRIVLFLLNTHLHHKSIYLARAGNSTVEDSYRADASLSPEGRDYAQRLAQTMIAQRAAERAEYLRQGGTSPQRTMTVWTSTRRRTVETGIPFEEEGFIVRERTTLTQLNPGSVENKSDEEIHELYPEELIKHRADPYHHRYPRGESYHDVAVRLESAILEVERDKNDILIIAHESVLAVFYAYFMACSATEIPWMKFSRDEVVEASSKSTIPTFAPLSSSSSNDDSEQIEPSAYQNNVKRFPVHGAQNPTVSGVNTPLGQPSTMA